MDLKETMNIIRKNFDEYIHTDLDDLCGDPYSILCGKDEFFKKLEEDLKALIDADNSEDDEVTHKVFFGENINRVRKAFKKK